MRAGGASGHHRVVGPFQSMADRNLARDEIDDVPGNEERADAPRSLFLENECVLRDPLDAANTGTDHHACGVALGFGLWLPAGICQCLVGCGYSIGDEVPDLALFARLEEGVRIERAFTFSGDDAGNLAGEVIDFESFDAPCPGLAFGKPLPAQLGP